MCFSYLTVDPRSDDVALRRVAALVARPLGDVARDARDGRPVLAVHEADGEAASTRLTRARRILEAHGIAVSTGESTTFRT